MSFISRYKKIPLLTKLLAALVLGVLTGAVFGASAAAVQPLGTIFLNLLRMVALPLVIINLIAGISSLDDPKIFGRIGVKIVIYYMFTTIIAIILGLASGYILRPGDGFALSGSYEGVIEKIPSLGETVIGLLPVNIFSALASGRFDQIVVFSAFVGIAVLFLGHDDRAAINRGLGILARLFNKLIGIVMGYAPIGVFALMAGVTGRYGSDLFGVLARYLGATYVAIILMVVLYLALLLFFAGMPPLRFLKKASPLIITTLSTCSSLAAVPVNLNCSDDIGVPRSISSFTIPLGSQINKDGNGIMLALAFLFAAQAVGAPLSLGVLVNMILISLILTTGAGGVPGGGIVSIAIVLDAFGLPLEVVGLISGIFALMDMGLTTMNCLGDLVGTIIVSRSEKTALSGDPAE
ncbi:MAG: dicarboxylate/amino acid:cation symporter [Synergistaceae bacterium]|jgi:Na+/H+-dicarboxylate symporter|nr:dicarboxylate/amino acid:cation symporter [Synergistaceae bacterium]